MRPVLLAGVLAAAACADEGTSQDGSMQQGGADLSMPSTGDGSTGPPVGEVFGSSQGTLYKLEPYSKVMTLVGDYDCIQLTPDPSDSQDGMADIAVDKDGQMYGIGRVKPSGTWMLVKIDRTTAKCTGIANVTGTGVDTMTGLSFVPIGTLDPTTEVLVGLSHAGDYFRFDLTTGAMTQVGSIGPNFVSKGADLVSITGDKTYATNGLGENDLIELDPVTGKLVRTIGPTHVNLIAGIGFWGGTLYGFNYEGKLFAIDRMTAAATEIPIPNPPAGLRFWGAAVTTAAPIVPVL